MNPIQRPKSATESERSPDALPPSAFNVQRSMFDVPQISAFLARIKNFFDYLGASGETPPTGAPFLASPWWLGLWWGLLIGLILLFCGQTSKFIYIDF